jgi:hypothetical protein
MRIRSKVLLVCLVCVALFVIGEFALNVIPVHVYDAFESSSLSCRWSKMRLVDGAVRPDATVVHSGHQSLAITVHSGDRHEDASDNGAATERDEIMESWWLYSRVGRTYVYSFSLFLPEDLPSDANRLVIAQWRQLCEASRCRPDNPILAIRYQQGLLEITGQHDQERHVLYQSSANYKGRWLDFRFVIKFNQREGSVFATLDGASIVDYKGPTVFAVAHGYPEHGLVYFKTGLYRDALNKPPWTLYVDDYRKDQCPDVGCR